VLSTTLPWNVKLSFVELMVIVSPALPPEVVTLPAKVTPLAVPEDVTVNVAGSALTAAVLAIASVAFAPNVIAPAALSIVTAMAAPAPFVSVKPVASVAEMVAPVTSSVAIAAVGKAIKARIRAVDAKRFVRLFDIVSPLWSFFVGLGSDWDETSGSDWNET